MKLPGNVNFVEKTEFLDTLKATILLLLENRRVQ